MNEDDAIAEGFGEDFDELASEGDFGDKKNDRFAGLECF